jgi:hypothetical protein
MGRAISTPLGLQRTTSVNESAPAWASSGEGDVDEARYRDVLGHSSTGVTRLTTLLPRRYSGNQRTIYGREGQFIGRNGGSKREG